MPIDVRILDAREPLLALRTKRALARIGLDAVVRSEAELLAELATCARPTWILAAGAWPTRAPELVPSATGRSLVGLGADPLDERWRAWLRTTAGEAGADHPLPPGFTSVLLAEPHLVRTAPTFAELVGGAIVDRRFRAVRVVALDARHDPRPRFAQVVTTLHRGGAERVALDLHATLGATGADSTLYVLDRPQRETYAAPPGTIAIPDRARTRDERVAELVRACIDEAHDVVHLHLVDAETITALERADVPTVTTLHNLRRAWPPGVAELARGGTRLFVACATAVAEDVTDGPPVRVAWNGVDPTTSPAERATVRAELDLAPGTLAVITVANPRAQKRLDLAAETIAELARTHDVAWILVGAPLATSADAVAATAALERVIAERAIERHVRRVGSREDVRSLFGAADVALSTSAWEGFSIAHLEAVTARVPLVTTDVSGARELERMHEGVHVCRDETPAALARAVLRAAAGPKPTPVAALGRSTMAARHAALYRRAVAPRGDGPLWLVTNNFSIGGAQASARRLLFGLRARGVDARAVVLEEHREHKTPWLVELEASGVPVFVAPRIATARAVERIAHEIDAEGVRAVVFWNAIAEYKLRLADALLGTPVFDVSPGEMYFASLDRYFARPQPDLPYLHARDYGRLLTGLVVKFEGEVARARATLGTQVHVVQNGVPLRPRRPRAPGDGTVRVGTLARISPDKKLEQLIEGARVARRHASRPFELRLAGPIETGHEPYARELEAEARAVGIRWVGAVGADAFLDELDLFALVAEPEGCPNASLEAMAAGLPVVATDAGGVSEQIARGETGLLVPRGDGAALGEALASLVDDAARRETMGAAAQDRIRAHFSVDRMVERYAKLTGCAVSRSASTP